MFHFSIGLVYRITCLLVLKISTDILYLMYSNSNEILFSYLFGALSVCLVSFDLHNHFALLVNRKKSFALKVPRYKWKKGTERENIKLQTIKRKINRSLNLVVSFHFHSVLVRFSANICTENNIAKNVFISSPKLQHARLVEHFMLT